MQSSTPINPFYAARRHPNHRGDVGRIVHARPAPVCAKLPAAPVTASPVPELTSLYHKAEAGNYGDRRYPGNCGGNLIKDLLRFFRVGTVYDPAL